MFVFPYSYSDVLFVVMCQAARIGAPYVATLALLYAGWRVGRALGGPPSPSM